MRRARSDTRSLSQKSVEGFIFVQEKRRYHRVVYREAVHYQILPGGHLDPAAGRPIKPFGGCLSWDLSEGGIRFRSDEFIPLNIDLSLQFTLGPQTPLGLEAKVVWVQKCPHSEYFFLGLEFKETAKNHQAKKELQHYISRFQEQHPDLP